MGLFSTIKGLGTSLGVLANLCGKTWDSLNPDDNISYLFKTSKDVICIINGNTTSCKFEFFPDSKTLIIFHNNTHGKSYHLKYIDENAVILFDEEASTDLCFKNRNSKLQLESPIDIFRLYFSSRVQFILERKKQYINYISIDDVDTVTQGLNGMDIIHCIDVFREFIPDFETEYSMYLVFYKKKYQPDYLGSFEERMISSMTGSLSNSYYTSKLMNPKESSSLNVYIQTKERS